MASDVGLLSGKILYQSQLHEPVTDFLLSLDLEVLISLTNTASNKRVSAQNKEEAVEAILVYTPSLERLFSYKRITCQAMQYYLYENHVKVEGTTVKNDLITQIQAVWIKKFPEKFESKSHFTSTTLSNFTREEVPRDQDNEQSITRYVKSNEFAKNFVTWFYDSLNNLVSQKHIPTLDLAMFCENSSLDIFFINSACEESQHSSGDIYCEESLRNLVRNKNLLFCPNLDTGTQALKSAHGLIKVLCCGTLHQNNSFNGIFEQEFGLCQNPADKRWKIFTVKLNLKMSVSTLPQLPPAQIFEIADC